MATFNFNLDSKRTIWYREFFEVEANTEEEAKEIAIKMAKYDEFDSTYHCEVLFDTSEQMSVEDNDNQTTQELYLNDTHEELIWDNLNK
jgi:hypothetical protein